MPNSSTEADDLRSLSTMDTLTFRRLRDGRRKSKQSDTESDYAPHAQQSRQSSIQSTHTKSTRDSIRRTNVARSVADNSTIADDYDGDTLTTLTNRSRWSRRRNSRGEATEGAIVSRRCIIDICLLAVLGLVLLAKFGRVETMLRGNLGALRRSNEDGGEVSTDGAAYAQWLVRQSKLAEYESDVDAKAVRFNNDHDAAEDFFEMAIDNLKNGVEQEQIRDVSPLDDGERIDSTGIQSQMESGSSSQLGLGGVKSQYESAQALSIDEQATRDTRQHPDGSMQRAPEFQSFEQAQIQHQLQQAIVQQQQQQVVTGQVLQQQQPGFDALHPNNILDTHQQQLNHLISEASDHGADGFSLNAQHVGETNNSINASVIPENPMMQPIPSNQLQIATWNIAAINNNPFEYWITYDENPEYENIMSSIELFLEDPGDKDVPVSDIFTDKMFERLEERMKGVGWESVRSFWEGDFRSRKIISGFMKDPLLGSKRLASMPDRVSNTINVAGSDDPVCRPTVINMYDGDLSTLELWWSAWEKFMFDTPLAIDINGEVVSSPVYKMLQPIKKAKYPDITEEEEKVSLPLQTMCGAIFDAILVHMMNRVSKPDVWQSLKKTMVENLNKNKVPRTLDILEKVYGTSDIITLQEVSVALINQAKGRALGEKYWIVAPGDLDAVRDQNSVIFLSKATFPAGPSAEITSLVEGSFEEGVDVPIAKGDILAITATSSSGTPFVICSFHGDTNGLATKPVLSAIIKAMTNNPSLNTHKLVFGLDANTYEKAKPGKQQDVLEWGEHYVSLGLTSCWGDVPSPTNYTTFNSRTYLQPQLNKACKKSDKRTNGDVNPKDFILFGKEDFRVVKTWKDNTGEQKYIEDMAFPTLNFPSDHGILATMIEPMLLGDQPLSQQAAPMNVVAPNQMLDQSDNAANVLPKLN